MWNDTSITNKQQVANFLAENISKNCYSENDSPNFQTVNERKEKKPPNFASDTSEDYNFPFSLTELKQALQKSKD